MSQQVPAAVWVVRNGCLVLAAPKVWKDGQLQPITFKYRKPA